MSNQKGSFYRKQRGLNEGSSFNYSNSRKDQSSFRKNLPEDNHNEWIGNEISPTRENPLPNSTINKTQSFDTKRSIQKSNITTETVKAPIQLIQDILKGLASDNKINTVNPYYSEQSEQKLTEILTNQNRLQNFISELEMDMSQADISVVKNYEMLVILLKHMSKSDVEVKHSSKGLELNFNRNLIIRQQNEIERLQKKIKEKDEHIKQIIQQYQSVISNFNDVIQKLLQQRTHQDASNQSRGFKENNIYR